MKHRGSITTLSVKIPSPIEILNPDRNLRDHECKQMWCEWMFNAPNKKIKMCSFDIVFYDVVFGWSIYSTVSFKNNVFVVDFSHASTSLDHQTRDLHVSM